MLSPPPPWTPNEPQYTPLQAPQIWPCIKPCMTNTAFHTFPPIGHYQNLPNVEKTVLLLCISRCSPTLKEWETLYKTLLLLAAKYSYKTGVRPPYLAN